MSIINNCATSIFNKPIINWTFIDNLLAVLMIALIALALYAIFYVASILYCDIRRKMCKRKIEKYEKDLDDAERRLNEKQKKENDDE